MSRNSLILFVILFLYVSWSPRGAYVQAANLSIAPNPSISVLDAMTKDKGLCPSGKPFSESSYAQVCKNFEYPKDDVTLKSTNSEQFMCLGLYDRIYRLCHLDTLRKTMKSVLPENVAQFDKQVAESSPKNGEGILKFCETWKHDYPPKYNKTVRFVTQLERAVREPALCVKHCTADDASVVPLCIVLWTMDNMSELTVNGGQSIEATSPKKGATRMDQPQTTGEHVSKDGTANSLKGNDPNAEFETSKGFAQSVKSTETQRTEKSSDNHVVKLPQESPGSPIADLESQQETGRILLTMQAGKVGTDAQVIDASNTKIKTTEKQNNEKPDQTATGGSETNIKASKGPKKIGAPAEEAAEDALAQPATAAAIAQPADGGALAQPADGAVLAQPADSAVLAQPADGAALAQPVDGAALAQPVDGAELAQHEDISGEDTSGEDIGGILDAAKLGSISQHTQEDPEPEFRGADGMDPAAVEPPALVGEVPDQTAGQASETREYIPHLPTPNQDDSHFFGYFTVIGVMCIAGYVGYHNKKKILAMVLEGRRARGGRSRRRPSTANYRKLDCTLEEAVTSQCNSNVTHVIY